MFFRIKPSSERRYLQIVENKRQDARTVQRVAATLGRAEDFQTDGRLDVLLRSGARLSKTALLISSLQAGTLEAETAKRIGMPMIFGRLWEQTGCRKVIEQLAKQRGFGFSIERAIFASALHRLAVSGSDRACERWLDSYYIDGADSLQLHQLYRAVGWLGDELDDQSGATRAPRRNKDLIEEALFERRRSLFNDLSVVLFDTTSFMFYGADGETLGKHGKSKDHRNARKGLTNDGPLRSVFTGMALNASRTCRVSSSSTGSPASRMPAYSHCDSGPASNPIRETLTANLPNQAISASGSLATLASRTIRPPASTTHTLALSSDTSIPA
jgi:hypothetical protein